ncbi:hypothetical protein EBR78_09330 [bacterium]|nr:hypothetical protein [bacterium]
MARVGHGVDFATIHMIGITICKSSKASSNTAIAGTATSSRIGRDWTNIVTKPAVRGVGHEIDLTAIRMNAIATPETGITADNHASARGAHRSGIYDVV